MDYEKFKKDCEKCEVLEAYLQEKIPALFGSFKGAAKKFAEVTNLKEKYAGKLLSEYRTKMVMKISPNICNGKNHDLPLEQLAILYELTDATEKIVKLTKEVNPAFEYPSGIYIRSVHQTNK